MCPVTSVGSSVYLSIQGTDGAKVIMGHSDKQLYVVCEMYIVLTYVVGMAISILARTFAICLASAIQLR